MAGVELTLAEKIALVRMRRKETKEVFCKRFGVKPLAVNHWEKGRSRPTPEHMEILKALFRDILKEGDESDFEIQTYQGPLPFDEPVHVSLRIAPQSESRVRLSVEVRRRAG
jgi:transcriptional regulator with XRE-family HTH domain